MGELSGTEDFEEEQAYMDRLDAAVKRGLCKVCSTVHSFDPARPDHTPVEDPMSWRSR